MEMKGDLDIPNQLCQENKQEMVMQCIPTLEPETDDDVHLAGLSHDTSNDKHQGPSLAGNLDYAAGPSCGCSELHPASKAGVDMAEQPLSTSVDLSNSLERLSFANRRALYLKARAAGSKMPTLRIPHGNAVEFQCTSDPGDEPQITNMNGSSVDGHELLGGHEAAPAAGDSGAPTSAAVLQCSPCTKPKKKVVFADAAGLQLASVRLMTEGRDTPPQLDPKLLSALHRQNLEEDSPQFSPQFAQPMSSYAAFMDRLARHLVCLESIGVITGQVTGTIKVKNISFEKEVIVRYTLDGWATFEDVVAYYVNPSDGPGSCNVYDTFAFSLALPSQLPDKGLQFAVCFRSRAGTFWDNNDSRNYSILWEPAHGASEASSM